MHMKDLLVYNSTLKLTSSTDDNFTDIADFKWYLEKEADFFVAEFADHTFMPNHTYTFSAMFIGVFLKTKNKANYNKKKHS